MRDTKRVLIVEDRKNFQKIFQEVVNNLGYQWITAAALQEAYDELDRRTFHVGLIDLRLNEEDENNRDGFKVLTHIQAANEGTQSIVLTNYGEVEDASAAFRDYKVFDFIRKQKMDIRQVAEKIREAAKQAEEEMSTPRRMPDITSMLGTPQERLMELFGDGTELEFLLRRLSDGLRPLLPYSKIANEYIAPNGDVSIQTRFWSKGLGEPIVFWFGKRDTMEQTARALEESDALMHELSLGEKVVAVFGEPAFPHLGGIVYMVSNLDIGSFKVPPRN